MEIGRREHPDRSALRQADPFGDGPAVSALSPVTMITRTPASRQTATAPRNFGPGRILHPDEPQKREPILRNSGPFA